MFNLNTPPSSLLGIEGHHGFGTTPKTPEIVNSLIAMSNPMDNYSFSTTTSTASTPGSIVTVRNFNGGANLQVSTHPYCLVQNQSSNLSVSHHEILEVKSVIFNSC